MLSPLPPLISLIITRLFKLLLLSPVFYLWHSGSGYCTYKCAVSTAADLEGARRRQSPPVSALQPRLQPASLESRPGPVELLLQHWVGEPKRGRELKLWWLRYAWNESVSTACCPTTSQSQVVRKACHHREGKGTLDGQMGIREHTFRQILLKGIMALYTKVTDVSLQRVKKKSLRDKFKPCWLLISESYRNWKQL